MHPPKELERAIVLYEQFHDYEKLYDELIREGLTPENGGETIAELKKYHRAKKRHRGIIMTAIGCVILVFGFILSIFLYHAGMSIDIALFGPTTVGSVLLIWGMSDIF